MRSLCLSILVLFLAQSTAVDTVSTDQLAAEIPQFLSREIAVHIGAVHTLEPPQDLILGAKNNGDFSWGTFMRAVADVSTLTRETTIAGRDLPKFLGQVGLIEARHNGKSFAQMYSALTLRRFGTDLKANPLWQSLTPPEQQEWRSLLDPARFYDRQKRNVINLADNYLGVASRLVTLDYQMGLITDRAFVDDVVDRAGEQFVKGGVYADDAVPTGRFDRYSQEYARYVYEAAETVNRKDVMAALEPSLKAQLRLWWDLMSSDGYGYSWGRSLGAISYMDTMEIVAFLAAHPQFRPAPLPQLAGAYHAAWQWLKRDYQPERHLLNVFGFGRGNYSYINPEREWQQTTGFFGKIAKAHEIFITALKAEKISSFRARPELPAVTRFEYFRKGDRPAGVWLVRQGPLHFALPITTGPAPGVADYLPAPHGLLGFAVPIGQTVPALAPYLEFDDGRTIVAGDGADEIKPAADGKSLQATWRRWVVLKGKPAQFVEPGLTAEVTWMIEGGTLTRSERISASQPVTVRRFYVAFPSTADRVSANLDRFESADGPIQVKVTNSSIPLTISIQATGNAAVGKGSRGPIPLILRIEATDVSIRPGTPFSWTIRIQKLPS